MVGASLVISQASSGRMGGAIRNYMFGHKSSNNQTRKKTVFLSSNKEEQKQKQKKKSSFSPFLKVFLALTAILGIFAVASPWLLGSREKADERLRTEKETGIKDKNKISSTPEKVNARRQPSKFEKYSSVLKKGNLGMSCGVAAFLNGARILERIKGLDYNLPKNNDEKAKQWAVSAVNKYWQLLNRKIKETDDMSDRETLRLPQGLAKMLGIPTASISLAKAYENPVYIERVIEELQEPDKVVLFASGREKHWFLLTDFIDGKFIGFDQNTGKRRELTLDDVQDRRKNLSFMLILNSKYAGKPDMQHIGETLKAITNRGLGNIK